MIIKKLTPGQRFLASGVHELYAEFSVSTNNDVGFEFSVPNVDSRRRGDHIAVQGLTDSTEVTLLPMAQAFPSLQENIHFCISCVCKVFSATFQTFGSVACTYQYRDFSSLQFIDRARDFLR